LWSFFFSDRQCTKINKSFIPFILISALVVDTILSNISDVVSAELKSALGITFFIFIMVLVIWIGHYLLFDYVKSQRQKPQFENKILSLVNNTLTIVQYVIIGSLIFTILQIVFTSQYLVISLIVVTQVSFTVGGIILAFLSYRFLSWYKSKRNTMILLYGLGAAIAASTLLLGGLAQNISLIKTNLVSVGLNDQKEFLPISNEPDDIVSVFFIFAYTGAILSYLLTWGASVLLLRHYSRIIGKLKFLLIILIPLLFFLIGIGPTLFAVPGNNTFFEENLILYRILSISSAIATGVLFGIAFIGVAKSLGNHVKPHVIEYLNMAAYGVILIFVTLAANIAHGAYPPFGIASYSIAALASYLFMAGIYSLAISVAKDSELRRSIKKYVADEYRLLDSIGFAQFTHEIEEKAIKISKLSLNAVSNDVDIGTSISDSEIRHYVNTVIRDFKKNDSIDDEMDKKEDQKR
jgi:hypothetical protein